MNETNENLESAPEVTRPVKTAAKLRKLTLNGLLDTLPWLPENTHQYEEFMKVGEHEASSYTGVRLYSLVAQGSSTMNYNIRAKKHTNGGYQIFNASENN